MEITPPQKGRRMTLVPMKPGEKGVRFDPGVKMPGCDGTVAGLNDHILPSGGQAQQDDTGSLVGVATGYLSELRVSDDEKEVDIGDTECKNEHLKERTCHRGCEQDCRMCCQ
jgi:hypothetical protein